jgi:hypothetical protein
MRQQSRVNRVAFRRAVWTSVALHVFAAVLLLLFLRTTDERKPLRANIDTHAPDEPQVRIHFADEAVVNIAEPKQEPSVAKPQAALSEAPPPSLPDKPFAPSPPRTLPPEMIALIQKPALSVGATVVEPPVPAHSNNTGDTNNPTITDPNVKPAETANASIGGAPAIHGALKPEQTVVYILDCSGSMGASGKFDFARAALVSTLRQQPSSVRFQVIVYAGNAVPLLPSDNRGLPATEANIRAAATELAKLEARGKSNHVEAVRAALAFRPDVILILTDAGDLNPAAIKRILASTPKPVPVCVGQVTAEGVQRPREVK